MALIDWQDTQSRLLAAIETKGRKPEWLYENILRPEESFKDLESLIDELKEQGKIHNHYGFVHLVTPDSELRRASGSKKKSLPVANPWAWYAWLPESLSFRQEIRERFSKDDAKVFQALASIIINERTPRIGERISGPITEEEGRYITKVNQALNSYLEVKNSA